MTAFSGLIRDRPGGFPMHTDRSGFSGSKCFSDQVRIQTMGHEVALEIMNGNVKVAIPETGFRILKTLERPFRPDILFYVPRRPRGHGLDDRARSGNALVAAAITITIWITTLNAKNPKGSTIKSNALSSGALVRRNCRACA